VSRGEGIKGENKKIVYRPFRHQKPRKARRLSPKTRAYDCGREGKNRKAFLVGTLCDTDTGLHRQAMQLAYFRQVLLKDQPEFLPGFEFSHPCGNLIAQAEERRPNRVPLFVSNKCLGLVKSTGEFYPEALWQRCSEHFYRNVWATIRVKEVSAALKAMHAREDRVAARQTAEQIAVKLKVMKLADAAELVRTAIEETLYYCAFSKCGEEPEPLEHFRTGICTDVGCRQAATGGPHQMGYTGG
jgi:hypothetical protein